MVWERIKRAFGSHGEKHTRVRDITWLKAADNPWGVPVLDVRPVTLATLSTSRDPKCASNAVSFGQDDGRGFIGEEPRVARSIETRLRFPIDRLLADGVLFTPCQMEHKWALFYHRGQVICVRSWLRQVQAVAQLEKHESYVEIRSIKGTLVADDEKPTLTIRVLDYLMRSHALDTVYPAPLPAGMEEDPKAAAIWCMSNFGNRALLATPHEFDRVAPNKPLRTHSLLHIAVARGDISAIEASLAAGMPIDLLAGDGLAPLHWALARDGLAIMAHLLERGSPLDVRSDEGATPLMTAVQDASLEKVSFLLQRGADANARDLRGFTALHRAAEMGHVNLVRVLLDYGAAPNPEAEGHTPRSLAERSGEAGIVALLSE